MAAWICANAAADGQVISAMSMVRSVPHAVSCAIAGPENVAANAKNAPNTKHFPIFAIPA
jgi:hypothetical protein